MSAWLPWTGVAACLVIGFGWWIGAELRTPGFGWYTTIDNHVMNVARARRFADEDIPLTALEFLAVAVGSSLPWILAASVAVWSLARRRAWRDPDEIGWVALAIWVLGVLGITVGPYTLVVGDLEGVSAGLFVSRRRLHEIAGRLVREFDVVTSSLDAPMRSLSGGNQQRLVLARELSRSPVALVAAQPTRGLDVGAIEYVSERIRLAAASGIGVLLISTELEEILALSHRVAVIHRGRIVGEMARDEVDLERLGLMMGGQTA